MMAYKKTMKAGLSRTLLTGLETEYQMRLAAENALAGKLSKLFSAAEKQILKEYLKVYNPSEILSFQVHDILAPLIPLEKEYSEIVLYENIKAFRNGRESTINLINHQLSRGKQLTLTDFNQNVYTNLANKTFTASARTMARVTQNITKVLAETYQEGWGVKDGARRIQKLFRQLKTYEARRIARTEINSSQNQGSFQTYYDYNIEYHQWWTGQDARVRATHQDLHGQIVQVGRPFKNGLLYPGDRNGSISEWINCRCTTVPYIMPLGFMAPPGVPYFTEAEIVRIPNFSIPRDILEF